MSVRSEKKVNKMTIEEISKKMFSMDSNRSSVHYKNLVNQKKVLLKQPVKKVK